MPEHKLTCRCGHSWQHTASGPIPADVSTICPICTAGSDHTVESLPELPSVGGGGDSLTPGQILGSFEIISEINRGGMGVIYKARQQGLNRLVALKVITPDRLDHQEAMHRFQREVQAAALLSHPNIVTVFHTDLDGPLPYLAMEYVAGIDLWRLVKRAGPLPVREACLYIRGAAEGLQHAFEQNLVHRDIKPANLMVTPSPLDKDPSGRSRKPTVKILDMGLARVTASHDDAEACSLTQAGEFLGTPDYIAPEQAEDARLADIRSDLYSLGGTFYYLLTGKVPFPGKNIVQKLKRQLTNPTPSVAGHRADVPAALDALIKKMMAREPADRYQTPADMIADLDAILRDGVSSRHAKKRDAGSPVSPASPTPTPAPRPTPTPPPFSPAAPQKSGALPAMPDWAATPPSSATLPASAKTPIDVIEAHPGGVRALSISTDGKLLLSGGQDETLRLWDVSLFRETRCIAGNVGPVESVCLAHGSKWAASCASRLFKSDNFVQCWDLASGSERRRLKGHEDTVNCVTIIHDGRRLASASTDRTLRIWALDQRGSPSICLQGHTSDVSSVLFLPTGDVLSGSHDTSVRLWDARTGAARGTLKGHVGPVQALAFCPRTKSMAMAGEALRVRQADGTIIDLDGHDGPVLCLAFSPDGAMLVSGGTDGTVRLWRTADGLKLHTYEGHIGRVDAVTFTPDGGTICSGGADGTLRRWTWPL